MAVVAAIETADYKNFKMLCAYVNQARGYLLLLRKELGEVPSVSYSPINWFSRVNLNLYAKDPAMDGNDPILADMEGVTPFPGRSSFSTNWSKDTFSRLKYPKDTWCDKGQSHKGGGIFNTLAKVVGAVETGAYVVDRIAFMSIDPIFNAYRWYLLEYMRRSGIKSSPCVRHNYIMTSVLRTSGKMLRGQGAFQILDDPIIKAVLAARSSFPPYSFYLKEVDTMGKKKQGGTRRQKPRARTTRRNPF